MLTTAVANRLMNDGAGSGLDRNDFAIVHEVIAQLSGTAEGGRLMASGVAVLPVERGLALAMAELMLGSGRSRRRPTSSTSPRRCPASPHLYVGEEAVAVGVCTALRRDDTITSTRAGHCIAKGATSG
jgi:TPP-dependent pyruvate/acetoin dehydrogenase alpha subunit